MESPRDPVHILLADDNASSRKRAENLIRSDESLRLVEVVASTRELFTRLSGNTAPEIALINAKLGGELVFKTLRQIRGRPPIILMSPERDFAADAFEIRALDYLLMPFATLRFERAMSRAVLRALNRRKRTSANREHGLLVYKKGEFDLVPYDQILYLQSESRGTKVETGNHRYESRQYLAELGRGLPQHMFRRIHRQYIVNVSRISRIRAVSGGRYSLNLRDVPEQTIPVGARYARELLNYLKF